MPRKRQIDPAFFSDEKMVALSIEAAFLYEGLWCWADDQANIEGSASQWRLWVFPGREVTVEQVTGWQEDLVASRRIFPYSVNGSNYYHMPNLLRHQKIQYPSKPRCPSPPDDILNEPSVNPQGDLNESVIIPSRVEKSRVQSSLVEKRKPSAAKATPDPRVTETMLLLEKERGYVSTRYGAEAKAVREMLIMKYEPGDIIGCWKFKKADKFFDDKECTMMYVQGQIGNWVKGGSHGENRRHPQAGQSLPTTDELKRSVGAPLD